MSKAEVGTCDLCGQEMVYTAEDNDAWHPYYVERVCPPEPSSDLWDHDAWQAFFAKGWRPGRPGAEHFVRRA